jgi:hypothetical protein
VQQGSNLFVSAEQFAEAMTTGKLGYSSEYLDVYNFCSIFF